LYVQPSALGYWVNFPVKHKYKAAKKAPPLALSRSKVSLDLGQYFDSMAIFSESNSLINPWDNFPVTIASTGNKMYINLECK
jgi:hypothetical protein